MATVAELRREIAEQRAQLGQLTVQVGQLVAANAALTTQIARLNERVAELLAIAQRRQRPAAPPPPPSPPPVLEPPTALAFADRPAPPAVPANVKPAAKPRRPSGRKPLPAHLEVEGHALRPDSCAHCGGRALDVAEVLTEENRAPGTAVGPARPPADVIPVSLIGHGLLASRVALALALLTQGALVTRWAWKIGGSTSCGVTSRRIRGTRRRSRRCVGG